MRIDDPGTNSPRPVVLGRVDPERLVLQAITARAYHSDCCATRAGPGYVIHGSSVLRYPIFQSQPNGPVSFILISDVYRV
jgi:hypothetical protein